MNPAASVRSRFQVKTQGGMSGQMARARVFVPRTGTGAALSVSRRMLWWLGLYGSGGLTPLHGILFRRKKAVIAVNAIIGERPLIPYQIKR
jgi:hypothetical protein